MIPDVVIPVRPGRFNEELRWTLRSLRNLPHRRVHIFGKVPAWVNPETVRVVERGRDFSKFATVLGHYEAACRDPEVTDPFVLFNDDFYVMEPIMQVPFLHRGHVADVIVDYRARGLTSDYTTSMEQTLARLRARGFAEPYSYELHVPLPIDAALMLDAIRMGAGIFRWNVRTAYGALAGGVGEQTEDVKIYREDDPIPAGPFMSTDERTLRFVLSELERRFPEPSIYEIPQEAA